MTLENAIYSDGGIVAEDTTHARQAIGGKKGEKAGSGVRQAGIKRKSRVLKHQEVIIRVE